MDSNKSTEATIDRIKTSFSSVYLTLISIIQAGVLGYFIYFFDQKFDNLCIYNIIPVFITFIVIVTCWNEYMMGSIALRWIPAMKDSFIPFILGISELFVIRFAFSSASIWYWYFSLAFFCFVGLVAYLNMFFFSKKQSENTKLFKVIGHLPLVTEVWSFVGILVFVFLGFLFRQYEVATLLYFICMAGSLLFFTGFLLRGIVYWHRITHMSSDK